jgi:hypothetical protein
VNLEVLAAPDCTSKADLTARVLARSPRIQFQEAESSLVVRASFTLLQSGNIASELTLGKRGARPSLRRLVARSCAQAADAVALIIAVTVDPTSVSEGRPVDSAAAGEPASKRTNDASPAQPNPNPKPSAEPAASTPDQRAASGAQSAAAPRLRFGSHVSAQVLFGVAPAVMPGLSLDAVLALDREALWSPAIVLGFSHWWRTNLEERGGTAAFMLDAASLDACALRIGSTALEGRVCAALLVGRLSAAGSDTSNAPDTVHRPFAALGASLVGTGRLHPLIELWARAALSANLVRDSFEFAPFPFHTVAPVSFSGSLGIGLRSR